MTGRSSAWRAIVVAIAALAAADPPPSATWTFNVLIPMRDGVQLAANVYRPKAPGRYPVIVIRTPYGKEGEQETALFFASHGYAVVAQDTRGRNDSDGIWVPFRHETDDGYDTIDWAAAQPWSNGRVATMGASYLGMVQWLAARSPHPNLAAMVTRVCPSDVYTDTIHPGGAFSNMLPWALTMGRRTFLRKEMELVSWSRLLRHLPLVEAPALAGFVPPFFEEWIAHPDRDDYWTSLSWQDAYERLDVPVFHSGGWYDTFQRGVIRNFIEMRQRGPARVRAAQRLVVGPWIHGDLGGPRPSREDPFGPESALELRELELRWLDHYVRGVPNGAEHDPAVRVFAMGEDRWRTEGDWPPPGGREVTFFLDSGGGAQTSSGEGRLSLRAPSGGPPDRFTYDPADPVPTNGAPCCEPSAFAGPADQREVERRRDVLVYTSGPMERPFHAAGPVTVHLFAATSARDTDWTAKLVDVAPDGFARNVTDGVIRARYRESFSRAVLLPPDTPHEFVIDLGYTDNVFLPGHRIRLEISSSSFPRISRNTNTGGIPELDRTFVRAQQSVFHDGERPSRLVLYVTGER